MASIEIRAKNVDGLGDNAQHLYIVYTSDNGIESFFRGGPEGSDIKGTLIGDIKVINGMYQDGTPDWDDTGTHHTTTIWSGTDTQMQPLINAMRGEMNRINSEGYDYNLPFIESLIPAWGDLNDQNSNTVVKALLSIIGLNGVYFISTRMVLRRK